jgi:hypothetical protein
MGIQTGKDGVIHIGGNAVAKLRGWRLNRTANRVDATVMGDQDRSTLAGFRDGSGEMTVAWDETDANGQQAIISAMDNATEVTIVLFPKGNVSTRPRITITNGVILGVDDGASGDDLLERTFQFGKASGTITEDTVP